MKNLQKEDPDTLQQLVLATGNEAKALEFREIFRDFNVDIKHLKEFGPIPTVIEDGATFEENALKKARFTARVLGLPAIADDSGLVVKALNGMPGVYSARYSGDGATDEKNNLKLLNALEGIEDRQATFMCVIVIAVPQGPALVYEGACNGLILDKPTGSNGFGYDPVFYYPPLKKTFAQISLNDKNQVSHRGKAMADLKNEFNKVLIWIKQRLCDV